jgi:sortase A
MRRREAPAVGRRPTGLLTRRRAFVAVGMVLVVVALLCGGWLGWQLVGTNVVAQRAQTAEVTQTVQSWEHAETAATTTIRRAPPPAATSTEPAVIRIPRFGKSYAVPIHPGVGDDVLARGFGHFDSAAAPGAQGNYALAAHRVTHGEPLRRVLELRPGDKVTVSTRHWTFVYRLDTDPRRLTVTKYGVWVVDYHPVNPRRGGVNPAADVRLLTLVTCSELFHTDDRTVVFGHLVSKRWRS